VELYFRSPVKLHGVLLRIQEVPVSNLGTETVFRDFTQSFQANAGKVP
jgi:hypothetical protein